MLQPCLIVTAVVNIKKDCAVHGFTAHRAHWHYGEDQGPINQKIHCFHCTAQRIDLGSKNCTAKRTTAIFDSWTSLAKDQILIFTLGSTRSELFLTESGSKFGLQAKTDSTYKELDRLQEMMSSQEVAEKSPRANLH